MRVSFDLTLKGLSLLASTQADKWTAVGTSVTPQVCNLRKGNNDQVAIAVDVDPGSSSRIEDEDDDKGDSTSHNLWSGS